RAVAAGARPAGVGRRYRLLHRRRTVAACGAPPATGGPAARVPDSAGRATRRTDAPDVHRTPARPGTGASGRVTRYVECRVAVEEAGRLQREPAVVHRHHRPVLGTREVGAAQRVPQHDGLAVDRTVASDERGQAGATGMLVDVFTGGGAPPGGLP